MARRLFAQRKSVYRTLLVSRVHYKTVTEILIVPSCENRENETLWGDRAGQAKNTNQPKWIYRLLKESIKRVQWKSKAIKKYNDANDMRNGFLDRAIGKSIN